MLTGMLEITPREVKMMMDETQPFVLMDMREPHEFQRKTHIHYRTFRKDYLTPDEGLGVSFLLVSSNLRCICT